MRSSTTFITLSFLVSLAMITAAPAKSPLNTINNLANDERQLQGLRASDRKLDASTNALNNQIQGELNTIGQQEGRLAGLRSQDAAVERKENGVGGRINSDLRQLSAGAPKTPKIKPFLGGGHGGIRKTPPGSKPKAPSRHGAHSQPPKGHAKPHAKPHGATGKPRATTLNKIPVKGAKVHKPSAQKLKARDEFETDIEARDLFEIEERNLVDVEERDAWAELNDME
ncbi:hypothetical protein C8J56DRAFT_1078132 [Mycena floridula]|nr:hypothetical protein C8J56DRAFT_1078132 [Mycena floridula]